jgi:hypothetical protein
MFGADDAERAEGPGVVPGAGAGAVAGSEPAAVDARRLAVEARALAEKAERRLDRVGAQDADDLVGAIEQVKDALGGDDAALKAAMNTLADLLYYLEA